MAWFPAPDWEEANRRWPGFASGIEAADHAGYCRYMEGQLVQASAAGFAQLGVAPIHVTDLLSWSRERALDPAEPETRAKYAAELAPSGSTISWPPALAAPCWCGSGRPYHQCCRARPTPPVA